MSIFRIAVVAAGLAGMAYPATLFFGTSSGKLHALNANTGKPVPGFGNEPTLDMKPGALNGLANSFFGLYSPPIFYKNLVITALPVAADFSGDRSRTDTVIVVAFP